MVHQTVTTAARLFFWCLVGASPLTWAQPDACKAPPRMNHETVKKYAHRWIEIQPLGCWGKDLPPDKVEVLLFYPGAWNGRSYGAYEWAFWSDGGRAWINGGMGATHWMYVPPPRSSPRASGSRYRDGQW